jgi:hypothetical protein
MNNIIDKRICPLCMGEGSLTFWSPNLRNGFFVFEDTIEDCPLCEADGHIHVIREYEHER